MKVEWAPLNVPLHRRIETFCAGFWIVLIVFGELIVLLAYLALLAFGNIYIKTLCIIYLLFFYNDRGAGETGGRGQGSEWVRNWAYWRYFVNYFPVHLVKTVELPADRNYLMGIFPHGLLSTGAFANFNTNATTWKKQFPGIRSKLLTLGFHFYIPVYRELVLSWGMCSVSAKNLSTLLSWPNDKNDPKNRDGYTSNASVIVIGGAQEALYMRPDNFRIVLRKRKGFVKIALRHGTSLVPVFSFGELNQYDAPANPEGSKLRRWQDFVKHVTGIAPTKFIGRGFFQYSYGLIPRRTPIYTVVGAPIDLPKIAEPTDEDVNKYHDKFIEGITELFETHKATYVKDSENKHLIIE